MTAATPMIRMTDIRKTYRLCRGMFAPTEELVAVNDLSLEVASPDEAREILELKGGDMVKF